MVKREKEKTRKPGFANILVFSALVVITMGLAIVLYNVDFNYFPSQYKLFFTFSWQLSPLFGIVLSLTAKHYGADKKLSYSSSVLGSLIFLFMVLS